MLTICCWKWGTTFAARHVNVLRAALARHLRLPHTLVCITEDGAGLDPAIRVVPLPTTYAYTPRCRRRMEQYSADFTRQIGTRLLTIDLDVVIVGDLTPILDRPEPIVGWRVGHAGVLSGSFLLYDAGAFDGAWQRFQRDPEGYPREASRDRVPSDQAMLNYWLRGRSVATWTEADGIVTYYGAGYERLEHLGVGPSHPALPPGARIVVLGSADLDVLQPGRFGWVDEHWCALDQRLESTRGAA